MKQQAILVSVGFVAGVVVALVGRPAKIETKTQVEYRDRIVATTQAHTVTTNVIDHKPDGEVVENVKIVSDVGEKTNSSVSEDVQSSKTVTYGAGLSLNALVGVNVTNPSGGLVYGLHASKSVLGPIALGAYGMSNGILGVSLGVQF